MRGEKMYFSNDITHPYSTVDGTVGITMLPVTCKNSRTRIKGVVDTQMEVTGVYQALVALLAIWTYRGSILDEEAANTYLVNLTTITDKFWISSTLPELLMIRGIQDEQFYSEFTVSHERIPQGEQLSTVVRLVETFSGVTPNAGNIRYSIETEVTDA